MNYEKAIVFIRNMDPINYAIYGIMPGATNAIGNKS